MYDMTIIEEVGAMQYQSMKGLSREHSSRSAERARVPKRVHDSKSSISGGDKGIFAV